MSTHQAFAAGLRNFLSVFTGRYSDPEDYRFLGVLLQNTLELTVDLLAPPPPDSMAATDVASRTAIGKFENQMRLAGFEPSQFKSATLQITRMPREVDGTLDGQPCVGANAEFRAEAVLHNGKQCLREKVVFFPNRDAEGALQVERTDDLDELTELPEEGE